MLGPAVRLARAALELPGRLAALERRLEDLERDNGTAGPSPSARLVVPVHVDELATAAAPGDLIGAFRRATVAAGGLR